MIYLLLLLSIILLLYTDALVLTKFIALKEFVYKHKSLLVTQKHSSSRSNLHFVVSKSRMFMSQVESEETKRKNIIVGLNPALQRIVQLSSLEPGEVHRASNVRIGIGKLFMLHIIPYNHRTIVVMVCTYYILWIWYNNILNGLLDNYYLE